MLVPRSLSGPASGGEMGQHAACRPHPFRPPSSVLATFTRAELASTVRPGGRSAPGRTTWTCRIRWACCCRWCSAFYQTTAGYVYFDASVSCSFFLLIGRVRPQSAQPGRGGGRSCDAERRARRIVGENEVAPDHGARRQGRRSVAGHAGRAHPVDAEVASGVSEVDVSLVPARSLPIHAVPWRPPRAGAFQHRGDRSTVWALALAEDSLVAELARIVEVGEQSCSRHVRLADKAARSSMCRWCTRWPFWCSSAGGRSPTAASPPASNAIATLIITCPARGSARRSPRWFRGRAVLRSDVVKSGDALERLRRRPTPPCARQDRHATFGRPALAGDPQARRPADAARLARASRHPLAWRSPPPPVPASSRRRASAGLLASRPKSAANLAAGAAGLAPLLAADSGMELWLRRGAEQPVRLRLEDWLRPDVAGAGRGSSSGAA